LGSSIWRQAGVWQQEIGGKEVIAKEEGVG
jgi:hypothetical protein